MKIYGIGIIDWFDGCSKKNEFDNENGRNFNLDEIEREFLYRLSKETYWEGDGDVMFFPVLTDGDNEMFEYACIIKQQNNGSTFVGFPDNFDTNQYGKYENFEFFKDTKEYKQWHTDRVNRR